MRRVLHVIAALKKVQDKVINIALSADADEVVIRRTLGAIHAEGIQGVAHVVDIHREVGLAGAVFLVDHRAHAIVVKHFRAAVDVLVQIGQIEVRGFSRFAPENSDVRQQRGQFRFFRLGNDHRFEAGFAFFRRKQGSEQEEN